MVSLRDACGWSCDREEGRVRPLGVPAWLAVDAGPGQPGRSQEREREMRTSPRHKLANRRAALRHRDSCSQAGGEQRLRSAEVRAACRQRSGTSQPGAADISEALLDRQGAGWALSVACVLYQPTKLIVPFVLRACFWPATCHAQLLLDETRDQSQAVAPLLLRLLLMGELDSGDASRARLRLPPLPPPPPSFRLLFLVLLVPPHPLGLLGALCIACAISPRVLLCCPSD